MANAPLTTAELQEIKQRLLAHGAEAALLSGSGATVFGVFREEAKARQAQALFMKIQHIVPIFLPHKIGNKQAVPYNYAHDLESKSDRPPATSCAICSQNSLGTGRRDAPDGGCSYDTDRQTDPCHVAGAAGAGCDVVRGAHRDS